MEFGSGLALLAVVALRLLDLLTSLAISSHPATADFLGSSQPSVSTALSSSNGPKPRQGHDPEKAAPC